MAAWTVDDQVLDDSILTEFQLQHLFWHIRSNAVNPDTLGGHTDTKLESDSLSTNQFSISSLDSFDNWPNIHELNKSIVRLLDINFKYFTKLFESLVYLRRCDLIINELLLMLRLKTIICHYYLSGDVSNKQSSGGFVVKFRQPGRKNFSWKLREFVFKISVNKFLLAIYNSQLNK